MEIVQAIPPKKTKEKKYMFVCQTCKKEKNGFNYSKTKFIANYPDDFFYMRKPKRVLQVPFMREFTSTQFFGKATLSDV